MKKTFKPKLFFLPEELKVRIPFFTINSFICDIITGFSGETEDDHRATLTMLKEIRFDSAFIYKYSLRPGTPAAKMKDSVPEAVKERRHRELLSVQRAISEEKNEEWMPRKVRIFVEEVSPKRAGYVVGCSEQERRIAFKGPASLVGRILEASFQDLREKPMTSHSVHA